MRMRLLVWVRELGKHFQMISFCVKNRTQDMQKKKKLFEPKADQFVAPFCSSLSLFSFWPVPSENQTLSLDRQRGPAHPARHGNQLILNCLRVEQTKKKKNRKTLCCNTFFSPSTSNSTSFSCLLQISIFSQALFVGLVLWQVQFVQRQGVDNERVLPSIFGPNWSKSPLLCTPPRPKTTHKRSPKVQKCLRNFCDPGHPQLASWPK